MPTTKKTTTRKKTATPVEAEPSLMEFEDFVNSKRPKRRSGRGWMIILMILIVVILGAAVWLTRKPAPKTTDHPFVAVNLDNGQVFYAKIAKEDDKNLYLDEVYYIQVKQQTVPAEKEGDEPQTVNVPILVKRGAEITRPSGYLQVNRDKVVSVEEIGQNSDILSEISRLNQQIQNQQTSPQDPENQVTPPTEN